MAKEIQLPHTRTGKTLYALIRDSVGAVWDTVGEAFVAYATANYDKYDIAMAEQGTASKYYVGDFPELAAGVYHVSVHDQTGANIEEGDPLVGSGEIHWNGTTLVPRGALNPASIKAESFANGAISRETFSVNTGLRPLTANEAEAGGDSSITLSVADASSGPEYYTGAWIVLTGGAGAGQARLITAYNGTTRVATVSPSWVTNPDNTTSYAVLPVGRVNCDRLASQAKTEVANAVWNEETSGHTTEGSTGKALLDAQSAGDPWATALPGAYGIGTAGKIVGDNIDAMVSSRASQASVDATQTAVNTRASQTTADAIQAKTDALPASPAATGDAMTLETDAISAAAISAAAAQEIADALLDRTNGVEMDHTVRQALRLILAACAGKLSGAGGATIAIRDVNDAKDRITAAVDADGNRTAVMLDPS